jgi:Ca2+-binding EF-hand superfamily protein
MDDDKNRKLSMDEFKKGVQEYGLNLSKTEIEEIFRTMDMDQNGSIEYEEFLRRLRVCFTLCEKTESIVID